MISISHWGLFPFTYVADTDDVYHVCWTTQGGRFRMWLGPF